MGMTPGMSPLPNLKGRSLEAVLISAKDSGGMMRKTLTALVAAASLTLATGATAEDWPTRPLTMVNPFAAGGPNDVPARLFAQRMGAILGQPIVLENLGGPGGMSAADRVAKATPDGDTFPLGPLGTPA